MNYLLAEKGHTENASIEVLPFKVFINPCLLLRVGRVPVVGYLIFSGQIPHNSHTLRKEETIIINAWNFPHRVDFGELFTELLPCVLNKILNILNTQLDAQN